MYPNNSIIRHCLENHPEVKAKKCELCDYVTIGAKYLNEHRDGLALLEYYIDQLIFVINI